MTRTLTLMVDVDGNSENEPFTFDFTNLLADLGAGWTLTGTPSVECSPEDGYLTIGAPVIDQTSKKVQVSITASDPRAALGTGYRFTCRSMCTNGTGTATRICPGLLSVVRWR